MKLYGKQALGPTRFRRAMTSAVVATLLGGVTWSWLPFFSATFFPIDDHEIVTYLSHRNKNGISSIFTGIYEFSPMKFVPNSTHWRPSIWIIRIVEAELFGSNFLGFALVRVTGLLFAGGFLSLALVFLLERTALGSGKVRELRFISALHLLLFVSSPLWTDVYGRNLAAERHLILSIAFAMLGYAIARNAQSLTRKRRGTSLILVGLTLFAISKENATYLVPAFGLFSLYSKDQFWRSVSRVQLFWLAFIILPLWITGCTTVFRSTFRGTSLEVPYAGDIGLTQLPLLLLKLPLNGYFGALGACLLIVLLSRQLRRNELLKRTLVFFTVVVVLEHVFIGVVGVSAPRYLAVSFGLTLFGMAMTCYCLVESRGSFEGSTLLVFFAGSALVCAVTGFLAVREDLTWLRDQSQEWNHEIEEIAERAEKVNADAIVIIVDPPGKGASGRVEKAYSLIKFLDWRLKKSVDFELVLLEMPSSQRYDSLSFRNLFSVATEGTTLNGGVVVRPFESSKSVKRLCVLYSTSGRESQVVDYCSSTQRFTL